MGVKDIIKGAGGVGKEFIKAFGQVAGGMKTDSKISKIGNKVSEIKTDVKKFPGVKEKVTFSGALGQVIRGSKVPEAGNKAEIFGRENWGKKPAESNSILPSETSALGKKPYYTRKEAKRWWAEELYKKENRGLLRRLMRYNPRKSGETRWQWADRINNELFGNIKEPAYPKKTGPIGPVIGDISDRKYKLRMRRKFLEKAVREEKRDFRKKEKKKLDIGLFDKFVGKIKQ